MNNIDEHLLMSYISTMPKSLWGSLEARVGISTREGETEPSPLRLHVYLTGIHQGREAVIASSSLYGDGGLEIHPLIAQELHVKDVDAITETPNEFLDRVFMSKAFMSLARIAGVMFTRDIKPCAQRTKSKT